MKKYIITFETSEASVTVRFEATDEAHATVKAQEFIYRMSNGEKVIIDEQLGLNE